MKKQTENYTKLDDINASVDVTYTETVQVNMDDLSYERDSLVRTQEANLKCAQEINDKIDLQIADLDKKIAELKELGLMTSEEYAILHPAEPPIEELPPEPTPPEPPAEGVDEIPDPTINI